MFIHTTNILEFEDWFTWS